MLDLVTLIIPHFSLIALFINALSCGYPTTFGLLVFQIAMSKRIEMQQALHRAVQMRESIKRALSNVDDLQSQLRDVLADCEQRILQLSLEVHSEPI